MSNSTTLDVNAPEPTSPCTVTTPLIVSGRSTSVWLAPRLPPSLVKTKLVVPVTFPVMVKVSDAPAFGRKFALRMTVPPPAKLPDTVSASDVSLSAPTSSVPLVATLSVPAVTLCVPAPKPILEPSPRRTVSHPVRVLPPSEPDTLLNASVSLPAPPTSSVTPENAPPAKVSESSSPAKSILPSIVAPVCTVTMAWPEVPKSKMAILEPVPTWAPLSSVTIIEATSFE